MSESEASPTPNNTNPLNRFIEKATFLNKGVSLYIAALSAVIIAVLKLFDESKLADSFGGWGIYIFCVLLAIPFLLVFLTDTLPKILQKRREKQLIQTGLQGQVKTARYFRLEPYQEGDKANFYRADNAQQKVLNWLLESSAPLLYLSGRSGTGKSSLLAGWVLPQLREQGFTILCLRAYHDPLIALREALLEPDVIWQRKRESDEDLMLLLNKACDKLASQSLLIVFDQFEELTIVQDDEVQGRFTAFLTPLLAAMPDNLKLLAVLRSDYLGKVEDLQLPPIRQDENWQEISPFDYAAARRFFQESGLELSPALLNKVLAEAGEIEENPGLLRPITLNILGVVLQRFGGGTLQGTTQGNLIRGYLREAVTEHGVADYAPLLLKQMISDAGTKIALSELALVDKTGLDKGTLRGCLVRLGNRGLVREVDENQRVWEVSHDFIARLLGQLVAGLLPSWWKRFRAVIAWSALALWLVALTVAYPAYQDWDYKRGRTLIAELGIQYVPKNEQFSVAIEVLKIKKIPDEIWQEILKNKHEIIELDISSNTNLSQLPTLNGLTALQSLVIYNNNNLNQLSALDGLTTLQSLKIVYNDNLSQLPALDGLKALKSLEIFRNNKLNQLPALNGLTVLQSLKISSNDNLNQLPALDGLTALQSLKILSNNNLTQLPALNGLTALQSIDISHNYDLSRLLALNGLTALQSLKISNNNNLIQLSTLKGLTALQSFKVSSNDHLIQLPTLDDLTALQSFEISNNVNLSQLPALDGLIALQSLQIFNNLRLKQLPALDGLTALQSLYISNHDNLIQLPTLQDLTALQSLTISNNPKLSQLPSLQNLSNLVLVAINQSQDLNGLQLSNTPNLKKLFLPDNDTGKAFANLLKKQRQQQSLKAVEIKLLNANNFYVDMKEELKKLKQP